MYYTYAHYTADTNDLFYIGKGTYQEKRPQPTRAASRKGRNVYWNRIVNKHGGFKYEVLASWKTEQEALDHEIFLIACLKETGVRLCNLTNGGEGMAGWHHTEDHKKRMSEFQKGNTYCRGRKLSKEHKELLSIVHKGVAKTQKHKENLSKSRQGLKVPAAWIKVKCLTTEEIFDSVTEAANKTGCDKSHIVKCCKGKLKKTKNMEFAYV